MRLTDYATNSSFNISYAEPGEGGLGGAVARARLALDDNGGGALEDLDVIWRQVPKLSGEGHFGYRIACDSDGKLWISCSERLEIDPAQDMSTNIANRV